MPNKVVAFSLPRWPLTIWLLHAGADVPRDIRIALVASLFGTLPIFLGGVVNAVAVSLLVAIRNPSAPFLIWLIMEVVLCCTRLFILIRAHRAAASGKRTQTDAYVMLAVLWGASVGYGAFVSMVSGDWVSATLACLSAAAMVGGICFRNFGAPRLVAVMIFLSLGPCCVAAALSRQPILLIILIQIPFYLFAMSSAAFRLNKLLVSTMKAERENDHRARHDVLTGLPNRAGVVDAMSRMYMGQAREDLNAALFYLDLDGFKPVNDNYGHAAGDTLLVMVAERLRALKGPSDLVARIGGDEFVVVVSGLSYQSASDFADRLIDEISTPFDLTPTVTVSIGTSIGVALIPEHGEEVHAILQAADNALYAAKGMGKARWAIASCQ